MTLNGWKNHIKYIQYIILINCSQVYKKIIFVGNIKYLPNKLACIDFTKNVLEKINLKYPEIEFHIIGDIGIIDKLLLKKKKGL